MIHTNMLKSLTPASTYDPVCAAGIATARYAQGLGIDEPLAMLRSGVTSYYEADGLGSVTSLSNSAGALAKTYVYDSFGNLTSSTGTITSPFQYTAREFDSETGLYYYRARYYDSTVGRFLSEDPVRFNGGTDFYTYVRNDPVIRNDPTGLIHQAWNEEPYDGRLHDDPGAGLEVLCRNNRNKAHDINWLQHSIDVRGLELARLGPAADQRHIDRWENEIATLERCMQCEDEKPEPKLIPADDLPKSWWQRNRTPILAGGAILAGAGAIALAPETGGASLLLFAF